MSCDLPKEILKKYWGYDDFRYPQEEVIQNIINGNDTLAILPTGGGKSICFQVPTLCKEGLCLVISPLISLIQDQVQALRQRGIKALALSGHISQVELQRLLGNAIVGVYKFVYMAPERLQNVMVQEAIKQMNINLIAIDEAHCISHWGQDFRPSYLLCGTLRELLPNVPILALTASATNEIQKDIISLLHLNNVKISKKSLERKNISYIKYFTTDKIGSAVRILKKYNKSSIIYVRNRSFTQELSCILSGYGFSSTYYHGGMNVEEKNKNMNLWLFDECPIMVATNAFGMGIDKPDVQSVIHWDLPSSLEDYFQEAGRAGRNGQASYAILLHKEADIERLKNETQKSQISTDYLKEIYKKINNFFFIPYGEGCGERFSFNFTHFTQHFGLEKLSSYRAMEVLERNGIIELEKTAYKNILLDVLYNQELFIKTLAKAPQNEFSLANTIIKNYPCIFQQTTAIKIEEISEISKINTKEIIKILEKWQEATFIKFKSQDTDFNITFLVPRDDERTINSIAPRVKQLNEKRKEQCDAVINYIRNNSKCLQKQLTAYFGEELTTPCGSCSYCLKDAPKEELRQKEKEIKTSIIGLLSEKNYSSNELCILLPYYEKNILKILNDLIGENQIGINNQNEIYLT